VRALELLDGWPVGWAAAGVVHPGGVASRGQRDTSVRLASVTKLVTALATLVAAEEGTVDLDEPAGPPGATVRHLLAHASGLPFEGETPIAPPGRRRVYSNEGFRVLAEHIALRAEMPFADYARAAVAEPLGLGLRTTGHPGSGMQGSLDDVLALGRELLSPTVVAPETMAEAASVQFPGLDGVVPGIGRRTPNDWGLGVDLHDAKDPYWMGVRCSARAFGHFGGSGTFLWVDPDAGVACAALTDCEFGDWALEAWPRLSDAVLDELGGG
jgi:CubicO group peptidase (beta-lactamase class C family)